MKKQRYHEAYQSLCRLWNTPLQAVRDLYSIHVQLTEEAAIIGAGNYVTHFIELFTIPRIRRATLASFTVMIAQQMCGILLFNYFRQRRASSSAPVMFVARSRQVNVIDCGSTALSIFLPEE
jgi:hypothetical protein